MKTNSKIGLATGMAILVVLTVGGIGFYAITRISRPLYGSLPQAIANLERSTRLEKVAQFIRFYDEILTQSARNYAFTREARWKDRYQRSEPDLDRYIKLALAEGDREDVALIKQIELANQALVDMEHRSLTAVDEGQPAEAQAILQSEEYWRQKAIYAQGMDQHFRNMGAHADQARTASAGLLAEAMASAQRGAVASRIWVVLAVCIGLAAVGSLSLMSIRFVRSREEAWEADVHYRTLAESAQDAIFVVGRDLRFQLVNSAAAKQLGRRAEEIIGKRVDEVIAPHSAERVSAANLQVLESGLPLQFEETLTFPAGERFLQTTLAPLRNARGEVVSVIGMARDITDRVMAEKGLRASEARYRLIAENTVDAIWTLDLASGRLTFASPSLEKLCGFTAEEVMAQPFQATLTPESARRVEARMAAGLAGFVAGDKSALIGVIEVEMPTKDGRIIPAEIVARALIDDNGRVTSLLGVTRDISERKRAEEALREGEARYRRIVETATEGIWSMDGESRTTYVNRRMAEMLGYDVAELMGREVTDFILAEDLLDHEGQMQKRQGGESGRYERRLRRADGSVLHCLLSFVATPDPQGRFAGSFGMFTDITERKRADELQEAIYEISEATYRAENLDDLYASIHSIVRRLMEAKNLYIALYDPVADLISFPYYVDEKNRPSAPRRPRRGVTEYVLRTGKPLLTTPEVFEDLVRRGEIELLGAPSVDWLGVPLIVGDKTIGVLAVQTYTEGARYGEREKEILVFVSRQIALAVERKRAQEALRESEEQFRALLEHAAEAIIIVDQAGQIRLVNAQFEELFGYRREEVLGKSVDILVPEALGDRHAGLRAEYVEHPQIRRFGFDRKLTARLKNGNEVPVELGLSYARTEDGLWVMCYIVDARPLVEVARMKAEFISTVSHELRTPLTSIQGSLGLLAGGVAGPLPDDAKSLVTIALDNSSRLVRLINDILDLEKIEAGKLVFSFKPVELMPIVEGAVAATRGYGEHLGVGFRVETAAPGARVNADTDRLTQVLTNLLSNAAKFSPTGGAVSVSVTREGSGWRVAVRDRGPGIPEAFRGRVFDKFAQADAADDRQKGGTGLGLSISKMIVEKHGGQIGFETETGVGTTFFFDLPALGETPAGEALPATARPPAAILICEGNPDVAQLLGIMLRQGGFATDVAHDAAQAKEMLERGNYLGMTLELGLPGQDGISLIRELRSREATRELPIIVVSQHAEKTRPELEGLAFGIVDWLSKPVDEERLLRAVRRLRPRRGAGKPAILHVEDDADVTHVVSLLLRDLADVRRAGSLHEARSLLAEEQFDLVLLDLKLPDGWGTELLATVAAAAPPPPVVVFSAYDLDKETAARVAASLVKSRTSNEELMQTISWLIGQRGGNLSSEATGAPGGR